MRYPERRDENPVELETQFIMRMPAEPAKIIKELIRSGVNNFKDRVTIRLENDVRYGEIRVDHYLLHAKVVDLPTVVESLKTIDNKSFYKTADICQMMICKEEEDQTTDEETPSKSKKKDPNKVDKKFLWPHGVTPPTKNVRKRRFRKTLKKKFVEQPEIEKEVKRLLRIDNDAVSIKWEVINEEDEQKPGTSGGTVIKKEIDALGETLKGIKTEMGGSNSVDVAEHEIFGSAVSDSDDENINVLDIDESSRLSAEQDDSRIYDSDSVQETGVDGKLFITQFSKSMFDPKTNEAEVKGEYDVKEEPLEGYASTYDVYRQESVKSESESMRSIEPIAGPSTETYSRDHILARMQELQAQLADLRLQQQQHEFEIASLENNTLRQRFQDMLDQLVQEMYEKELELQEWQQLL